MLEPRRQCPVSGEFSNTNWRVVWRCVRPPVVELVRVSCEKRAMKGWGKGRSASQKGCNQRTIAERYPTFLLFFSPLLSVPRFLCIGRHPTRPRSSESNSPRAFPSRYVGVMKPRMSSRSASRGIIVVRRLLLDGRVKTAVWQRFRSLGLGTNG